MKGGEFKEMKKGSLLFVTAIAVGVLFIAVAIAGTTASDVIKMENKIYEKHDKGIVEFSHKKHATDYKATCGECHHDKEGKPLELKEGDDVQSCAECHSKAGEKPKGKDAPKLTDKQELEYHAEAVHDNCQGCHKEHNKKNNTKAAPTTCTKCHPKTK
jgi:hypothetical protein